VPEDERTLHDEVGDATVLEVVDVAAAYANRAHPHEHLAGPGFRHRTLFHAQREIRAEHTRALGGRNAFARHHHSSSSSHATVARDPLP